jgi:quinol monooxygenase YgiN
MKTIKFLSFFGLGLFLITSCGPRNVEKGTSADSVPVPVSLSDTAQARMIVAKVYVKQDKINDFVEAAKEIIEKSNMEPGCKFYQLYQDPYVKTSFVFVERYRNQRAVEEHFSMSYFKNFGTKIADMISEPAQISILSLASEENK